MKDQFKNVVWEHLGRYRQHALKISAKGTYRGGIYDHILPQEHYRANLLEPVRDRFWEYASNEMVGLRPLTGHLHKYFHHLNSSQAMCFNLFYPFLVEASGTNQLVQILLGQMDEVAAEARFEHVICAEEGTNFDFFIRCASGRKLLFECKFTETEFGQAKADQRHRDKLEQIYKPMLRGKAKLEALQESTFFKHYQLLRNAAHVNPKNRDHLFIIFPRGNPGVESPLVKKAGKIYELLEDAMHSSVSILLLEDIISRIEERHGLNGHWSLFREKYLPPV